MKEPYYTLEPGTKIRTHDVLESTRGMMVVSEALQLRRGAAKATITAVVGGHGGDVYWAKHADGDLAPYCFTEFELEE